MIYLRDNRVERPFRRMHMRGEEDYNLSYEKEEYDEYEEDEYV